MSFMYSFEFFLNFQKWKWKLKTAQRKVGEVSLLNSRDPICLYLSSSKILAHLASFSPSSSLLQENSLGGISPLLPTSGAPSLPSYLHGTSITPRNKVFWWSLMVLETKSETLSPWMFISDSQFSFLTLSLPSASHYHSRFSKQALKWMQCLLKPSLQGVPAPIWNSHCLSIKLPYLLLLIICFPSELMPHIMYYLFPVHFFGKY